MQSTHSFDQHDHDPTSTQSAPQVIEPTRRRNGWVYSVVAVAIVGLVVVGVWNFPSVPDSNGGALVAMADEGDATDKSKAADTGEATGKSGDKKAGSEIENPFPNRIKAPSLEGGVEWLNTAGPIALPDLRGKVVLVDFWTYCCINCIHILPDLKHLEHKYPEELVVIGCHSAKFDNEKDSDNIRQAIMRYEIEHPVINDANMVVWRKMGARSWPTLVLIDPEGYYCGYVSGEGNREILESVIDRLIAYHESKGTLDRTPVRFDLEADGREETPLRYPGKILADPKQDRLFISDSNHNRIVITKRDGTLLDVVGSGRIGARDGDYQTATFDHPQGIELVGNTLYVADTENHLIRTIDLEQKTVSTLAGTGSQARMRVMGGINRDTALNSPWDLLEHDGVLYIAMAGPHQIWQHRIGSNEVGVYAGTGREDILDGLRLNSALAQPSGLATDGEALYVCDSEGSAIRRIDFKTGAVTTVAGTSDLPNGRSLFEFGDVDGKRGDARLQHPLGIAAHEGLLYIADTYNHKLKTVDSKTGQTTTWLGTGERGTNLDPPQFFEPAGLSLHGETLFIADTNNNRILTANIQTGKVAELSIKGLTPPPPPKSDDSFGVGKGEARQAAPQVVKAGDRLQVSVEVTLPEDYKLNELAPVSYKFESADGQTLFAETALNRRQTTKAKESPLEFEIPTTGAEGSAQLTLTVSYGYCRGGDGGLCKIKTDRWLIPISASSGAKETVIKIQSNATQ